MGGRRGRDRRAARHCTAGVQPAGRSRAAGVQSYDGAHWAAARRAGRGSESRSIEDGRS